MVNEQRYQLADLDGNPDNGYELIVPEVQKRRATATAIQAAIPPTLPTVEIMQKLRAKLKRRHFNRRPYQRSSRHGS